MEPLETENYNGYTIEIYQDEDAAEFETPNDWEGPILVYNHTQFYVGPENIHIEDIVRYLESLGKYEDLKHYCKKVIEEIDSKNSFSFDLHLSRLRYTLEDNEYDGDDEYFDSYYSNYHIFSVYAYIHSGVALSLLKNRYPFTVQFYVGPENIHIEDIVRYLESLGKYEDLKHWDVNCSGFVLIEKEEGDYEDDVFHNAETFIEDWNKLLRGEVVLYKIKNSEGEEVYSLGNIYGINEALESAKDYINHESKQNKVV